MIREFQLHLNLPCIGGMMFPPKIIITKKEDP